MCLNSVRLEYIWEQKDEEQVHHQVTWLGKGTISESNAQTLQNFQPLYSKLNVNSYVYNSINTGF